MIAFTWPWTFALLPLPLLTLLNLQKSEKRTQAITIVPSLSSALNLVNTSSASKYLINLRTIKLLLLCIAWLSLLTAIAQPYKAAHNTAQPASGRALSLLIDLSTSMERRDFAINGEPVDRLTVVKDIAGKFIANRTGDRVSLVLFGSEAFIASPLSYDLNAVNTILRSSGIGMAGRTTAMGNALGLAIQSLRKDPATEKAIILLSDGTNNAGVVEPEDAAQLAKALGIVVHTIGLGSDESTSSQQYQSAAADLDEKTLQDIAIASGGKFFRGRTSEELKAIYQQIDKLVTTKVSAPPLIIKQDYRNIFIAIALLCFVSITLLSITIKQSKFRQLSADTNTQNSGIAA